jgi:hypothetical protein
MWNPSFRAVGLLPDCEWVATGVEALADSVVAWIDDTAEAFGISRGEAFSRLRVALEEEAWRF